ncbi:MAG: LysR family transcriptional regulator [Clostridiales bacterium]|jgi:DNA-binding transcriptional LysR family regulator|nr:LysR family transcriptional regulator [Clostridiales bacterium]
MQLNHLKYILKVAELGSITKAAHELYISQPSLTKTISNLEKHYNIKIFERTATGVSVTSEGRHFLYYAKNVVCSANSLERSFQDSFYINQIQLLVATQTLDFIPEVVLNTYKKYSNHNLKFEVYESHRSNVIKAIQKKGL